jgi:CDP-6-deoxy-D-xylo-4-hexulose-3-dehydrase
MSTTTGIFVPKLHKLSTQISDLVQQYAQDAYALVTFAPGQSAVPFFG